MTLSVASLGNDRLSPVTPAAALLLLGGTYAVTKLLISTINALTSVKGKPLPPTQVSPDPSQSTSVFIKIFPKPLRNLSDKISPLTNQPIVNVIGGLFLLYTALPPPAKTALGWVTTTTVLALAELLKPTFIAFVTALKFQAIVTMHVALSVVMPVLGLSLAMVLAAFASYYVINALFNRAQAGLNNMKEAFLSYPISMKNSVLQLPFFLASKIPGYSSFSSLFKAETEEQRRVREDNEFLEEGKKIREKYLEERRKFLASPSPHKSQDPGLLILTDEVHSEVKSKQQRLGIISRRGNLVIPDPNRAKIRDVAEVEVLSSEDDHTL